VGPLPRNRVVPFRRNQVGPFTRNPALTHTVLKSLLERLALRNQPSCTTPERAFVAGCEFIAAAHNGDLAACFRDSLSDARALAAGAITHLGEPALAARLLGACSTDIYDEVAADIRACSQRLDAGLEQWAAHLCRETESE
jgi:hypothetical protein